MGDLVGVEPGRTRMLKPHWFQILLSLADRDLHGQAIRDEVLTRTDGRMHLWPAMLYGSLNKLQEEGLIIETEGPSESEPGGGSPRVFQITPEGRAALSREVVELEGYLRVARAKDVGQT